MYKEKEWFNKELKSDQIRAIGNSLIKLADNLDNTQEKAELNELFISLDLLKEELKEVV